MRVVIVAVQILVPKYASTFKPFAIGRVVFWYHWVYILPCTVSWRVSYCMSMNKLYSLPSNLFHFPSSCHGCSWSSLSSKFNQHNILRLTASTSSFSSSISVELEVFSLDPASPLVVAPVFSVDAWFLYFSYRFANHWLRRSRKCGGK